jgi:hypothetical protein
MGTESDLGQGAHAEYTRRLGARRETAAIRSRHAAIRSVAFYERAFTRLESRWAGGGTQGEHFRDPHHAYADDLDLVGEGSLFELLCAARTRAGEDTLAAWLLGPATPEQIRLRQEAVRELTPRLDLREDLARLGDEVRSGLHPEPVCAWGAMPAAIAARAPAAIAAVLAALALAGLVCWMATPVGPLPFLLALLLEAVYWGVYRRRFQAMVRAVELPGRDLGLLAHLLERLERESYRASRLVDLRAVLETSGAPASACIARLRRLIDLLDARRNQLFLPVAAVLLWTPQLAFAIERWRARFGPDLGRWIDAIGEFEALCSLAGFSFEHPDYAFPEILEGAPRFEGVGIGHPLLPDDRCVRNDVTLFGEKSVLIISGSNMSGKSTLLRSVGINTVLGLAGAPACANELRLSPVAIGASIRIQDSLLEGNSRFYTEILRLRQVTELAQTELPVLFLLDEILSGTNSHDRGIGAEAVVRNLVESGAIGLVTTHDLALTRLADSLAPRAANVHFQDHLEDGVIAFDYRIHPGVVTKSNALELMRAVGLDV